MNLHTLIIAEHSEQLLKYLSYAFDHPFSLVDPTRTEDPSSQYTVTAQMLQEWLKLDQNPMSQCVLSYNISLKADTLRIVLQRLPTPWNLHLFEYHGKSGELIRRQDISYKEANQLLLSDSDENTYALQLTFASDRVIRIYFLPTFLKRRQPLIPSLHQIFKLLHVVQSYYSLDKHPEDQVLYGDTLAMDLSDFLYEQQVGSLKLILRAGPHLGDQVLQQVGRLNAPQKWMQKQQYRDIKREVYFIKKREQHLLKELQEAKGEVTSTINQLLRLSGKNDLKYHQICLETLKQLKSDSLNKKTAEINELDSTLKALDLRRQQLSFRKEQILHQNQKLQHQQITDLLKLKNQVLQLQNKQQSTNCKSRVSPHKQLITTIFSRAQQKKEAAQRLSHIQKTEAQVKAPTKTELKGCGTGQFRQAQKKMAAVVRQGGSQSSQLNLLRVQEQREHAFLEVDFEAEKQFSEKLTFLRRASATLARVIEAAEQMMFFDQ